MNNNTNYNGKLNVLGPVIKEYRIASGLSQTELSAKLLLLGIDVPKNSVQRLEDGKRVIKDYELGAISKVLQISTDTLLKDFIKSLD